MLFTTCPVGSAITDLITDECPINIGQIQKILFQRKYSSGSTLNSIAYGDANDLATWTTLLAAADGTKVQVSPFVKNPVTEVGEPIENGSGNEVRDGIPETVGFNPTIFTTVVRSPSAAVHKALRALVGEELVVWLVNERGRIWAIGNAPTSPTTAYGIPVQQFAVGDRNLGGFQQFDEVAIRWGMPSGWSDNLIEITPADFDARNLIN